MSEIYELTAIYRISKSYVLKTFEHFFNPFTVVGAENIPHDGTIIFAPNHLNALMDALAVLDICPKHFSVSFLARADIFKKPLLAKFLRFAKIMPAYRSRDGFEQLGKNQAVFEQCVHLLQKGNALCIMPEGNQGELQQLRPLVKGIFRIAFATQQALGTSKNVRIVPIGIDYGNITKFGKHAIVNIGQPIDVSDYIEQYNNNPAIATNALRKKLSDDISSLMLDIRTTKHYTFFQSVLNTSLAIVEKCCSANVLDKFKAQKVLNNELHYLEANDYDFGTLPQSCEVYEQLLAKHKLRAINLHAHEKPALSYWWLAASVPLFLWSFVFHFLPFMLPLFLRSAMRVEYEGFFASIQYAIGIVSFPLFYLLQTIAIFALFDISIFLAPLFMVFHYFMWRWSLGIYAKYRAFFAYQKLKRMRNNNHPDIAQLQQLHNEIIGFVQQLNLPVFEKSKS